MDPLERYLIIAVSQMSSNKHRTNSVRTQGSKTNGSKATNPAKSGAIAPHMRSDYVFRNVDWLAGWMVGQSARVGLFVLSYAAPPRPNLLAPIVTDMIIHDSLPPYQVYNSIWYSLSRGIGIPRFEREGWSHRFTPGKRRPEPIP